MQTWQISVREITNGFLVEYNDWGEGNVQETTFVQTVDEIPKAVLDYLV